jgi:hypothetical protein
MPQVDLIDLVKEKHPTIKDVDIINRKIVLQDDCDGTGVYIAEWNFPENLDASLEIYRR